MFWIGGDAVDVCRCTAAGVHGDSTGTTHERGVELVDVDRRMVERLRHIGADGTATVRRVSGLGLASGLPSRRGRGAPTPATGAALLCAFTITGHNSAPALASLPMAGVLTAPATVLAQPDPIRVVALALIRLVVARLALLACEGDRDSNVSAGHVRNPCVVVDKRPWAKKNPAQARGPSSLACFDVEDPPTPSPTPSSPRTGGLSGALNASSVAACAAWV